MGFCSTAEKEYRESLRRSKQRAAGEFSSVVTTWEAEHAWRVKEEWEVKAEMEQRLDTWLRKKGLTT